MARKDKIMEAFLQHDYFNENEETHVEALPKRVKEAHSSDIPIIRIIALIIEKVEANDISKAEASEISKVAGILYPQITANLKR